MSCGVSFLPHIATASADLVLSPVSKVVIPGKPFTASIRLSNNTDAINAVSGTVTFPSDLLSVTSISKAGSFVKLWSNEPSFSNQDGTINFEGVVFNPGYSLSEGTILNVTFLPKRTGKADILFSSGLVLANDGNATNVLRNLGAASYTITATTEDTATNTTTPVENPLVPNAPKIVSSTHPSSTTWYNDTNPSFSWDVPHDVSAIRAQYDSSPSTAPTRLYDSTLSKKELSDVTDGVHYMHVQFKNAHGWGSIAHFKFQIDTRPPRAFAVTLPGGIQSAIPSPLLSFNAVDDLSGIDHYEIKVGDSAGVIYKQDSSHAPYEVPAQSPGSHIALVRAFDKAGNSTVESIEFTVAAINVPTIISYPQEIEANQPLKITGTTYPDSTVTIYMKNGSYEAATDTVKSDTKGNFSMIWSGSLGVGIYKMTADVTDTSGARSLQTVPVTIAINEKVLFRVGWLVVNYLTLSIIIVLAVAVLMAFVWFVASRLAPIKKRLRRDVSNMESTFHKSLKLLKEDLRVELELLQEAKDRRSLTKEEKIIVTNLNRRIDSIEKES